MIRIFSAGVTFALVAVSSTGLAAQATPTQATPTQASPTPAMPMHELTFSEVKAQADRLWNRLDANHDGRIDRADRDARLLEHFAMADTNHDGVISKDEFLAAMRAREAKWKEHGRPAEMGHAEMGHAGMGHGEMEHGGPPPPGAPRDHPPGGMGMGMGTSIIGPALRGARSDGVITRAAFDAALKTRFDAIDANHDGRLSHEELRAARRDAMYRDWKGRDHRIPPPPPPPGTGE
jgi:hypothetical protein